MSRHAFAAGLVKHGVYIQLKHVGSSSSLGFARLSHVVIGVGSSGIELMTV